MPTEQSSNGDCTGQDGIKCLGCKQVFDTWREIARHRKNADHPDVGEVYM